MRRELIQDALQFIESALDGDTKLRLGRELRTALEDELETAASDSAARVAELERENAELRERLATVRRELSGAATRLRCEADDVESIGHMNEAEDIRDYADRLDRISKLAALTPPPDEKAR
jgi:molecular chaperone GrpE (heat shock protein)